MKTVNFKTEGKNSISITQDVNVLHMKTFEVDKFNPKSHETKRVES